MKIKPLSSPDDVSRIVRNNPNTVGTHIAITDSKGSELKEGYGNLALLTITSKNVSSNTDMSQMRQEAQSVVDSYEKNDVMGL